MSYLLDPPMLVATGAAIEESLGGRPSAARVAGAATVATFIGVSVALYANASAPGLSAIYRPFGSRSGREFMLTSGLGRTDGPKSRTGHALALSQFVLYPAWLALGRAAWRGLRHR